MDKLLALISFAVICTFLGIMIYWVRDVDLTIVCLVILAMIGYDFYRLAFRHK